MQYVIILILYDVFVTLTQLYGSLSTRTSCYRIGLLRFHDSIFGSVSVRFCTENRGFGFSRFRFYVKFG